MVQVQESELRAQAFDSAIKGIAERKYKFKQALSLSTTAAWINTFYRESTTSALAGQPGNAIRASPRLALPARNSVDWARIDSYQEKYFFEDEIAWEDIITNQISVQGRTLFRISEGIVKGVDDAIYSALTNVTAETDINQVNLAQNIAWDLTSAAIIDDLGQARQLIAQDDIDAEELMCFVSPKDMRSINTYIAGKGSQFPQLGTEAATNGRIGQLVGITFVMANNVTASQALVVVPKLCAEWKEAAPLQTETTTDPFRSVRIRAVEIGVTHILQPKAICLIRGTQSY